MVRHQTPSGSARDLTHGSQGPEAYQPAYPTRTVFSYSQRGNLWLYAGSNRRRGTGAVIVVSMMGWWRGRQVSDCSRCHIGISELWGRIRARIAIAPSCRGRRGGETHLGQGYTTTGVMRVPARGRGEARTVMMTSSGSGIIVTEW